MKKLVVLIAALAMTLSLFAGCSGNSENVANPSASSPEAASAGTASPAGDTSPIIIGGINDLSGSGSVLGVAIDRGAKLAVEEINAAGGILGREIKFISYDNKNDATETINAYNRLCDIDKASAVIAPPGSTICKALVEPSNEKKVALLGLPSDPSVTMREDGTVNPYVFLVTQPNAIQQAHIMADFMFNEKGAKKAAVFYDQANAYSSINSESFIAYWQEIGGEVVVTEAFKNGDTDFKTQLNKIKSLGAEFIYCPNTTPNCVIMADQCSQIGLDIPFVGAMDMADPFLSLVKIPDLVDAYFPAVAWMADEKLDAFNTAYQEQFGEAATVKSISGYDSVYIIKAAIEATGKTDAESIAAAVANNINGITLLCDDNYTQDPQTNAPKGQAMVICAIEDGVLSPWGSYKAND